MHLEGGGDQLHTGGPPAKLEKVGRSDILWF